VSSVALQGGLALLLLADPGTLIADEVRVADGSVLKGEVVRHTTDALRLKTTFSGTIEIEWSQVETVILDEPVTVLFDDDSTLEVWQVGVDDGQFVYREEQYAEPVRVEMSRVAVIAPDAWELGQGHQFTGRVNLAWENETGNSERTEFDLDFNMDYRWRDNHLLSYGELEYDTTRGFRSADNWTWFSNLDHTFEGKWYYAGAVMFKKDRFADLKLRTLAGPGMGYRFFQSKRVNLRAELGIYYLKDDFYDQADDKFWGPAWFIDYDQMIWKQRLQLYHRQMGFLAANDSNKYLWRAWTGLRLPLLAGFVGSVEYEIDYDSQPAVEAETTDTAFNLKLGYEW
jgi:putative salt-induced outer membrane protein YdiY